MKSFLKAWKGFIQMMSAHRRRKGALKLAKNADAPTEKVDKKGERLQLWKVVLKS